MIKSELTNRISSKLNYITKKDVSEGISFLLEFLSSELSKQNRIEIRGFGTFSLRRRNSRIARNPKTGKAIHVNSKLHTYFRASKSLKRSTSSKFRIFIFETF